MVGEPDPRLRPEYAHGKLVPVTTARHPAEAEMLRDMLLAEGIPTMVRPARSFDPRFFTLGMGAHDVLVRESGYDAAYELVHGDQPQLRSPASRSRPEPGNLLALVLLGLGLIAFLVWLSGTL
jgi:hypothetical protein